MKHLCDLHTHSLYSDGILTPEELLQKAVDKELKAISITDHDNVEGCIKALSVLDKYPVEFIVGIELSSHYESKEFHVLGYDIDLYNPELEQHLIDYRDRRLSRATKMHQKLGKLGFEFNFDDILIKAGDAPIGRPHIASVMVDHGMIKSLKEGFSKYLYDYGPAYEAKTIFPIEKAIQLINKSGGVAVLAHPGNQIDQKTLYKFIKNGLDGIEVIHPSHNTRQQKYYHSIASQYWLIETGGSDYHGNHDFDESNFGKFAVPYSAVESIRHHSA